MMLQVNNINKTISSFSLCDINFTVDKGDYFMLVGESGAGKTMLLEMIMGLVMPDRGMIFLNNSDITNTPIQKRNIGIVYQTHTLFPHMTVYENIAYPLKNRNINKHDIDKKVQQLAEDCEISQLLDRNTTSLSGGEAQRVTIARTLALNPYILLLDEPLTFLDVKLKKDMSSLLRKINLSGQTIMHVTHDYEEAIALANKIAILEKGTIIQTGSLHDVFHNPKSEFVARFIGIKNFYKGLLQTTEHNSNLKEFITSGVKIFTLSDDKANSEGYIIIPGEGITISEEMQTSSAVNNFEGTIVEMFPIRLGVEVVIDIGIKISAQITQLSIQRLQLTVGKKIWINFKASAVSFNVQ